MKNNGLAVWVKENAWSLVVTLVAIAMTFATLSARVSALEIKISEYPSEDWFALKFETLQDEINDLEGSLLLHNTEETK